MTPHKESKLPGALPGGKLKQKHKFLKHAEGNWRWIWDKDGVNGENSKRL